MDAINIKKFDKKKSYTSSRVVMRQKMLICGLCTVERISTEQTNWKSCWGKQRGGKNPLTSGCSPLGGDISVIPLI